MADVQQLLEQYATEFRAGQSPDPRAFLDRVEGSERSQLEDAIECFLTDEPRRPYDATAFATSPARHVTENLERAMTGQAGLWPSLLPRLRTRARLRRKDLITRLAVTLGVPGEMEKVGAYYHRMEQGTLPAAGVSERVLDALGRILGETGERLRAAGQALDPMQQAGDRRASAFARTSLPTPGQSRSNGVHGNGGADSSTPGAAAEQSWDQVDRLFRGG